EEQRRDREAIKVEVAERDPERVGRALGRRKEELGVALWRLHQRGPCVGPRRTCSSEQYSAPAAMRASARGRSTPHCTQRTSSSLVPLAAASRGGAARRAARRTSHTASS